MQKRQKNLVKGIKLIIVAILLFSFCSSVFFVENTNSEKAITTSRDGITIFRITTEVGENSEKQRTGGTITGEGAYYVERVNKNEDATIPIIATPDDGYYIEKITLNGEELMFEVDERGAATLPLIENVIKHYHYIVIFEPLPEMTVNKIDGDTQEPLEGVEFQIEQQQYEDPTGVVGEIQNNGEDYYYDAIDSTQPQEGVIGELKNNGTDMYYEAADTSISVNAVGEMQNNGTDSYSTDIDRTQDYSSTTAGDIVNNGTYKYIESTGTTPVENVVGEIQQNGGDSYSKVDTSRNLSAALGNLVDNSNSLMYESIDETQEITGRVGDIVNSGTTKHIERMDTTQDLSATMGSMINNGRNDYYSNIDRTQDLSDRIGEMQNNGTTKYGTIPLEVIGEMQNNGTYYFEEQEDGSYISNNGSTRTYAYSYIPIDLTGLDGEYIVAVEVSKSSSNSSDYEWATITDGSITASQDYGTNGQFLYSYGTSLTNRKYFSQALSGDSIYNLHLGHYQRYVGTSYQCVINSINVYSADDIKTYTFEGNTEIGYTSNNKEAANSTANAYIPIDLTGLEGDYAITLDAQISSESGNDIGYVTITDDSTTTAPSYSTETGRFVYISGEQEVKEYKSKHIKGGEVYYLHLGYYKNASKNTGNDQFIVSNINVYPVSGVDTLTFKYDEMIGGYIPNNTEISSTTANAYIPINLSGLEGEYTVVVNASVSSQSGCDYGYATITESIQLLPPTYSASSGRFMCISGEVEAKDYKSKVLTGGGIYNLHLGYRKDGHTNSGNDQVVIHSINVYPVTQNVYTFASNGENGYESNNYNSDSNYTYAKGYMPIDLSGLDGNYVAVVEVTKPSGTGYGYAHITDSSVTTTPSSSTMDGRIMYVSSTTEASKYTSMPLEGGKAYNLHFGYYKESNSISENYKLVINSIKLYPVTGVEKATFVSNGAGGYVSNNAGKNNTFAKAYIPIDLTNYEGTYQININATISSESSNDYALAKIATSANTLQYSGYTSSSLINNSGTYEATNFNSNLTGGKVYYLHLGYYKNHLNSSGDDKFEINSISVYPVENGTYTFVSNGVGGYVSNNQNTTWREARAYIPINLTEKTGEYIIKVNASVSSTNSNDYGWVNLQEYRDNNSWYSMYTNGSYTLNRYLYGEQQNVEIVSNVFSAGKEYRLELRYYNYNANSGNDEFTINSIEIYEVQTNKYTLIPNTEGEGYVSNNQAVSCVANGYVPIDLTGLEGDYVVSVKAYTSSTGSSDYGYATITNGTTTAAPGYSNQNGRFMYITGITEEQEYTSEPLAGGKKYNLHLGYRNYSANTGDDKLFVSSINVYKASDTNTYTFVPSETETGTVYISNNQTEGNTTANAYVPINLKDYQGEYIVAVDAAISSESSNDYGYATITDASVTTPPKYNNVTGRFMYINGVANGIKYSTVLRGGSEYNLHLGYYNSSANTGDDQLVINSINVYPIEGVKTYTFELDEETGKYTSNNQGKNNTTANAYMPIDLSGKTGVYVVVVNATISSERYDYGYATITDGDTVVAPVHNDSVGRFIYQHRGTYTETNYTSGVLKGGKKYNLHFGYEKNESGTSYADEFIINSVHVYPLTEANTYTFISNGAGGYVSNNAGKKETTANTYVPIDLTGVKGDYTLTVNAQVSSRENYGYGYAAITSSEITEVPAYRTAPNKFMDITGIVGAKDYTTILEGGKVYNLQLGYYSSGYTSSEYTDKLTINSVKVTANNNLYYVETETNSEGLTGSEIIESAVGNIVNNSKDYYYESINTTESINAVGEMKNTGTDEYNLVLDKTRNVNSALALDSMVNDENYYFVKQDDGSLVPTNSATYQTSNGEATGGVPNTTANSYIPINLTSETGDYAVVINASVSSQKRDVGYATITDSETTEAPYYAYTKNRFMYIYGESGEKEYVSTILKGGEEYNLHLGYYKNSISDEGLDQVVIHDINIYPVTGYEAYTFVGKQTGEGYVSNNQGKNSTTASAYVPIDLSSITGEYIAVINAEISSENNKDFGYITLTDKDTVETPSYNSKDGRVICLTGKTEAKDYKTKVLEGGQVYNLHFGYYKDSSLYDGDDQFVINSINIYPLNGSGRYTFIPNENGGYVSENTAKAGTIANAYIPIDLTNHSGKYKLTLNASVSSETKYGYGYATITESAPMESIYSDTAVRFIHITNVQEPRNYTTVLDGGKKYYLQLSYENTYVSAKSSNNFTVNGIGITPLTSTITLTTDSEGKAKVNLPYYEYNITEVKGLEAYEPIESSIVVDLSKTGLTLVENTNSDITVVESTDTIAENTENTENTETVGSVATINESGEVVIENTRKTPDTTQTIEKTGTEEITKIDETVEYTVDYKATVDVYEGDVLVTVVDTLPYAIDTSKTYDLAGGKYDEATKTITWEETISGVNTFTDGIKTIEFNKKINMVFKGINPNEEKMTNQVTGKIKLYTPEEEPDPIEDSHETTFDFKKEVKVTKQWLDDGDLAEKRPESIKIVLKNGDSIVREQVLTTEHKVGEDTATWEYTFTELPKYNDDGTEITYIVEEQEQAENDLVFYQKGEITPVTIDITDVTVENTFKIPDDKISITASKVWEHGESVYTKPTQIILVVKNGELEVARQTLTVANKVGEDENTWSYEFTDLPKYDSLGNEITYTIEEIEETEGDLAYYKSTIDSETNTITNTYIGPIISQVKEMTTQKGLDYVIEGEKVTYKIIVTNEGLTAKDVVIKDTIPEGMTFEAESIKVNGEVQVGKTVEDLSSGITVNVPAKENDTNGKVELTFDVTVDSLPEGEYTKEYRNIAYVDEEPTNEVIIESKKPDITYEKEVDPASGTKVKIGDTLTYTIKINNAGTLADTVTVKDSIPEGSSFVEGSIKINEIDSVYTEANLANGIDIVVNAGATASISFKVTVNQGLQNGFVIRNQAYVDDIPTNDVENPVVTPIISAEKRGEVKTGANYALRGDTIDYTIIVRNSGGLGKDVIVKDTIPTGATFVEGSILVDGQKTNYTESDLATGISVYVGEMEGLLPTAVTIKFSVTVNNDATGDIRNIATADDKPTEEVVTPIIIYEKQAVLDLKSDEVLPENTVTALDEIVYTIVVRNTGTLDAGKIVVTDPIPDGTTFKEAYNNGAFDNNVVTWELDGLAKGETANLSFRVVVNYSKEARQIKNTGYVNEKPTNEIITEYQKPEITLTSEIVKTGTTEVISSTDLPVYYEMKYTATINKFVGDADLVIVDTLPYPIDVDKSTLDGGEYDEASKTITWKEKIENIDTFKENKEVVINRTKIISLQYIYGEAEETLSGTLYNKVEATIDLLEPTEEDPTKDEIVLTDKVDDDHEVPVEIPAEVIVHHYLYENGPTITRLADDENYKGIVGDPYTTKPSEKVTKEYLCRETKPENFEGNMTKTTIVVIYYYELTNETVENTIEKTTNVDVLRNENGKVGYTVTYTVTIKDYVGKAKIVLTDKLPANIDVSNSNLAGGNYEASTRTITWKETVEGIDTFANGDYTKTITKQYVVVYDGQNVNSTLVNTAKGTVSTYYPDNHPTKAGEEKQKEEATDTAEVPQEYKINKAVKKVWDDNNNAKGKRPESVKVHLTANGRATGQEAILSNANGWEYTFTGLAKYDQTGNEIRYSAVESEVNANDLLYYEDAEISELEKIVLTNEFRLEETELESKIDKTGTEKITSSTEPVSYNIEYTATIKNYIGNARLTIIDTLPYKINVNKSDLAGGTYDADTQTITWVIDINNVDTIANGDLSVRVVRGIQVVYQDLDASAEKMTNHVKGRLVLLDDDKKDEVEDTHDTLIDIYGRVIVKYVDQSTNKEIADRVEKTGKVGEGYTTEQKDIPTYTYIRNSGNTIGEFIEGTIEVIYYYDKVPAGGLIVKYVDEDGVEIADREGKEGYVGEDYTTIKKDIEGYEFEKITGEPTGQLIEGIIEVIYHYKRLPANVIVRYLEKGTEKPLADEDTIEGKVADPYETSRKVIDGYRKADPEPTNSRGNMTKDTIYVIYYYERIPSGTITVKYVDIETKEEIPYIDEEGNEKTYREELSGYVGERYTTNEKDIPGYEYVKELVPANKEGYFTEDNDIVIYYYRKLPFNMAVEKRIKEITVNGEKVNLKGEDKVAKQEVVASRIATTEVRVIYEIIVTNTEKVKGTATLAEAAPAYFSIDSYDTNSWEKYDEKLIATIELEPGQSKVYEIGTKWDQTANSFGQSVNVVKITGTENDKGYAETTLDDNQDYTTVVMSIKTGRAMRIGLTMLGFFSCSGLLVLLYQYQVYNKERNKAIRHVVLEGENVVIRKKEQK